MPRLAIVRVLPLFFCRSPHALELEFIAELCYFVKSYRVLFTKTDPSESSQLPTQILPAASLRSTNRLPAVQVLLRASNYLMRWALWSIGRTIFGVASKFHPAL